MNGEWLQTVIEAHRWFNQSSLHSCSFRAMLW